MTILSAIILFNFFHFQFGSGSVSLGESIKALYQMVLDLFPEGLFQPFVNVNIPQILILAVLFGLAMRALDNRVNELNTRINDVYVIFMNAVDYGSRVIPVFIFCSLTNLLWTSGNGVIISIWKPVLALIIVYLILILLYAFIVAVKYHVSLILLLKKISPSTLIGLSTASSMAAFGKINEVNESLGLDKSYTEFSVPIGMQLYCGAASAIYIAIAYYLAETFQTNVNFVWFFSAAAISLIVSAASPPVSGGTILCLNILIAALGIPSDGLATGCVLALLFDFISTGSYIAMRHLEMVLQAGHLNCLNVDTLRSNV